MKITKPFIGRIAPLRGRREERGMAVIVVLALLAIILLYIAANARTLDHLGRELRLLEKKQTRRLASPVPNTNSTLSTTASMSVLNKAK